MALNNPGFFQFAHISGAVTNQVVFVGKGIFHAVVVNTAITTATAFDAANAAGAAGPYQISAVGAAPIGAYLLYDVGCQNGLVITTTGTGDITVLYST